MSLKKEFATAKSEALAIRDNAKAENRPLTADEKQEYAKRVSRCKEIKAEIETKKVSDAAVKALASKSFNKAEEAAKESKMEVKTNNAVKEAVNKFGRTGDKMEFALTSGSNSGVLMPKEIPAIGVVRTYANSVRRVLARLGLAPQINSSYTDNMEIPLFNDSANSATTNAEGVSNTNTDASVATKLTLNLIEYHSEPQFVTKKAASVSDHNITDAIVPAAINRIERKEDADWLTKLKTAAGVTYTTATTGAFVLADLIGFINSLGGTYAGVQKGMIVSQDAKTKMESFADSTGRTIFDVLVEFATFRGVPIEVSPNLSVVAAGNTIAVLVAFDGLSGTVVRDYNQNEIVRYENQVGYAGQVGFEALGWSAIDANPYAVSKLVVKA